MRGLAMDEAIVKPTTAKRRVWIPFSKIIPVITEDNK